MALSLLIVSTVSFARCLLLLVYQPDVKPIRIMAVLRGKRQVKCILKDRP